jgi:hypothetical protein
MVSAAPTFEALGYDVRCVIYKYSLVALLPSDEASHTDTKLNLDFSEVNCSLFRLSKIISWETLHFFHTKNVFVVVKSHNYGYLRCLPALISQYVPVMFPAKSMPTNVALTIDIGYKEGLPLTDTMSRSPGQEMWQYDCVFLATDLPKFLDVINRENDGMAVNGAAILMKFALQGSYYQGNNRVKELIINGSKNILQSKCRLFVSSREIAQPIAATLTGGINEQQSEDSMASTNLPPLTAEEYL